MFAVVRSGGKQYRVAPGQKIVVDKIAGEAGARVTLGDVLFASGGATGVEVAAEIIAQAKGEKVVVFKKKRRHNYRRKAGHRQQHTVLQIVQVGDARHEAQPRTATVAPAPAADLPVETAVTELEAVPEAVAASDTGISAQVEAEDAVAAEPAKKGATRKAATKKTKAADAEAPAATEE